MIANAGSIRINTALLLGTFGLMVPNEVVQYSALQIALGCLFVVVLTPLHEFAHANAAWLVGQYVYKIKVGAFGRLWFRLEFGRCRLDLRYPFEGGSVESAQRTTRFLRTRAGIVIAAGPLLHVVLIGVTWHLSMDYHTIWWSPAMLGANGIMLWGSIWPKTFDSPEGSSANDGLLLLQLFRLPDSDITIWPTLYYFEECQYRLRRNELREAIAICETGMTLFPQNLALSVCRSACDMSANDWESAIARLRALHGRPETRPEDEALLLTNLAFAELMSHDADFNLAKEYSTQAFAALPWRPEIQGVHGGVLVEVGDHESGMNLLRRAIRDNEEAFNKACNSAYLALGYTRLGDAIRAESMLNLAQRLDGTCSVIARVESELAGLVNTAGNAASSTKSTMSPKLDYIEHTCAGVRSGAVDPASAPERECG